MSLDIVYDSAWVTIIFRRFFATSYPSFHQQVFLRRASSNRSRPIPTLDFGYSVLGHYSYLPNRHHDYPAKQSDGLTAGCSWRIILVSSIFTCYCSRNLCTWRAEVRYNVEQGIQVIILFSIWRIPGFWLVEKLPASSFFEFGKMPKFEGFLLGKKWPTSPIFRLGLAQCNPLLSGIGCFYFWKESREVSLSLSLSVS